MKKSLGMLVLTMSLNPASAQIYTYDNETQLIGAAMSAPSGAQTVMLKAMDFCSSRFDPVKSDAGAAAKRWQERHSFYLTASAGYREAAMAMIADPKVAQNVRDGLRKLIEIDFPRLVRSKSEAILEPLRVVEENGAGESMCRDYIRAVDTGKYDLKLNDPQLADFLDRRAPRK